MQRLFSLSGITAMGLAVLVGFSAPAKADEVTECATDGDVAACAVVDDEGNAAISVVDSDGNQVTVAEDSEGNSVTEVIEVDE